MTIDLFIPCYIDACYPEVGVAVVAVLERLGHVVRFDPAGEACCGQPAYNSGYWPQARGTARRVVRQFAEAEAVVVPSGSCGAMLKKFYPTLLTDPAENARARSLAKRTFEFSDFLVNQLGVSDVGAVFRGRVTVHDGCHGLRELGCKTEARTLLRHVRGLELIEMSEAETCCGFGGTFGVKFPMISTAMGEVKCASALATGATHIVSTDSSCLMQIGGLLSRQKSAVRTIHLAEVLASR